VQSVIRILEWVVRYVKCLTKNVFRKFFLYYGKYFSEEGV